MRITILLLVAALAACGGRSPAGWRPGDGVLHGDRRISDGASDRGSSWCPGYDPSTLTGDYRGTWSGVWSCFGSATLSGDVTLALTRTETNFKVVGTWTSGTLPSVSGKISGSSSCNAMTGTLSGSLGSGVSISFTGTVNATFIPGSDSPYFTSGTWSASATTTSCTGSGSWSASR